MNKQTVITITAVLCLTILGIFIIFYMPESPELLWAIVIAVSGLLGVSAIKRGKE